MCTDFLITISLDNNQHSGSIPVAIKVKPKLTKCKPNLDQNDVDLMTNSESEYIPLDVSVIVIVFLSCGTYIRSLIKSYLLAKVSVCMCVRACVCVHVCVSVCAYVCISIYTTVTHKSTYADNTVFLHKKYAGCVCVCT